MKPFLLSLKIVVKWNSSMSLLPNIFKIILLWILWIIY